MKLKTKIAFYKLLHNHVELVNRPIRVVGNSMLPVLSDGDEVQLSICDVEQIQVGDIIVYRKFSTHLTVHRVIQIVETEGKKGFQTKGDNNAQTDTYLVLAEDIVGKIKKS